MSRGPSRYELNDGTDISRMTVSQIREARGRAEADAEARHRRRLALMRAEGETNRQEAWMAFAAVLAAIALILSVM